MQIAKHSKAIRVQHLLGSDYTVLEFDQPAASAAQAAAAIGCSIAQIAKSLVFIDAGNNPVLVVASGANRVDETKVSHTLNSVIHRADADFVKKTTRFSIGGVPPVGHDTPPTVLLDQDLQHFTEIWAAGGTPSAVFKLTPQQLAALTGSSFADVVEIIGQQ